MRGKDAGPPQRHNQRGEEDEQEHSQPRESGRRMRRFRPFLKGTRDLGVLGLEPSGVPGALGALQQMLLDDRVRHEVGRAGHVGDQLFRGRMFIHPGQRSRG